MPTNNRASPKADGNQYVDKGTFAALVSLAAQLALIAASVAGSIAGWVRGAGVTVLGTIADLVGIGTATPTSKLTVAGPIATTFRNFTTSSVVPTMEFVQPSDSWIECSVAIASHVENLPSAASCAGREIALSLSVTGVGGSARLKPSFGQTIDGGGGPAACSVSGDYVKLKSDGVSNWKLLEAKVAGVRV